MRNRSKNIRRFILVQGRIFNGLAVFAPIGLIIPPTTLANGALKELPESSSGPERSSLVVITDDAEIFPEIRRYLGEAFEISLATNENEIKSALEQPALHAILFNLDAVGQSPSDGLEVIEEIRKIRDGVVLAAYGPDKFGRALYFESVASQSAGVSRPARALVQKARP
jgi:hypothetical protein